MSLGKRTRHPMRRTPSVSGITFDLNLGDGAWPSGLQDDSDFSPLFSRGLLGGRDQRSVAMVALSPRALHQRHSSEFPDAAHFLRTCSLCKRRLFPGRDIYMYRGDSAFCSLECRQQQMNLDERKEKCGLASKKEPSASTSAATTVASSKGEMVVAAAVV